MGQSAKKHIIDSSRAERLRRSQKSTRVKRWLLGVARSVYAVFMLYLVLPLIVGINFELFISLPARYGFSNDITPVLHVWDAWPLTRCPRADRPHSATPSNGPCA
jgi:E3 ubiquitin-protein ligase MARCH6